MEDPEAGGIEDMVRWQDGHSVVGIRMGMFKYDVEPWSGQVDEDSTMLSSGR